MALHYNLAKVYALSDNDPEFVLQIVNLFVTEVPDDLEQIKEGIKKKDHKHAYAYAHKIKPTLDLLGLKVAFEEILQVETFKSVKNQVEDAVKELKKDFDL
jgi:HPt (histidine-containing phosphotransfer) domain-containing protein